MRWTKEGLEIDLIELTIKIRNWANERDLHRADPDKQILKLGEEFGELCQGKVKNKYGQVVDSIGDMYVVLTILSMQIGTSLEDCVSIAYNEIKERKGKMINGVYVKEDDFK